MIGQVAVPQPDCLKNGFMGRFNVVDPNQIVPVPGDDEAVKMQQSTLQDRGQKRQACAVQDCEVKLYVGLRDGKRVAVAPVLIIGIGFFLQKAKVARSLSFDQPLNGNSFDVHPEPEHHEELVIIRFGDKRSLIPAPVDQAVFL